MKSSVLFLGSSVTYGVGGVSFAEMMAEELGFECIKEAVSGTTLADRDASSYVSRLKTLDKNLRPELCICQLSTNDAVLGVDIGLVEEAIRFIVKYARETFGCGVAFYTSPRFDCPAYEKMEELCLSLGRELGFPVLDLWNDAGINGISPQARARYMSDPVHPTLEGYRELWLPRFVRFYREISEKVV